MLTQQISLVNGGGRQGMQIHNVGVLTTVAQDKLMYNNSFSPGYQLGKGYARTW